MNDQGAHWYKTAVFYEVLVRSFQDGDGDGQGDLRGLTERLDYLQWLGVDCLWLPPFYDSPLRDGGYDISDYRAILAASGTVDDFAALLEAAHARGIRVITDLVLNHTSDRHPWFQRSRREPDGPYGDFYVWADDDRGYPDARIIFVDTETSNWAYDSVRGQYYFHRFFSHQPDLNYDNPRVRDAVLEVVRFWMDLGIDGFRLDAAPYLYAVEGTNCENLPATHDFLKLLRKTVDDEYPGRLLLAEANQWPADAVSYFGDPATGGDECHMAFHFPLMPRLFMALSQESRLPVSRVLAGTPAPPEHGQWGIFLRNHDELTLEMVDDEERAHLYGAYATDPRMRANIGIRRRLAPLLGGDRARIELMTSLLLSLPGSPILYYGDEIGMGDNIWLPDRDSVRTPMQWSPDRNAGVSTADPGRLYPPVLLDPVYGYQAVSVEAQRGQPNSLLNWTRRALAVRRAHPAFGLGDLTEIPVADEAVFAMVRQWEDDVVLCVANFSGRPRAVDLDLGAYVGRVPVDLTGGERFPVIREELYRMTLAGHGFWWLGLGESEQ
jgi:maltose alpha-D-glucosyltransferase/alpha-amylase